jgi:death-on-curing protein
VARAFSELLFPDVELLLMFHEEVLHAHGGAEGLRDLGLLESATASPQASFGGAPLYDSLAKMAGALAFALAKNHPFVDGNKRVAFLAAATFLAMNGAPIPESPDWEILILGVADSTNGREDLIDAFARAMGDDVAVEADE